MEEKTKQDYRKLASHFYKTKIEGLATPKKITDALLKCAGDYRPAYWRKLRNALELDQSEKGYKKAVLRLASCKNPITKKDSKEKPKAKQKRAKSLKEAGFKKLLEHTDKHVGAALIIAKITGCRPAEMETIRVDLDTNIAYIIGAKKTEKGDRGLDRAIGMTERDAEDLLIAVQDLQNMPEPKKSSKIKVIQTRLRVQAKKAFSRTKALPSLYTLRHQMGSNLKGSGMDRQSIAYCMGHQSTKSIEVYGNSRSATGSIVKPEIEQSEIKSLVRENHREPLSKRQNIRKNYSNDMSM